MSKGVGVLDYMLQLTHTFIKFVIAASLLLPIAALAKGGGVGFTMDGTVTNVTVSGENIQFTFTGTFRMSQFRGIRKSVVEIDCEHGVSATVSQGEPFFAMSSDGRAGAIRPAGALLKIFRATAERNRKITIELRDVKMEIGKDHDYGHFTLSDAKVIRATDADLR